VEGLGMSVLVTGATGFVGANLLRALAKREKNLHILLRKTSDVWRIKDIVDEVSAHYCDLTDKNKVRTLVSEVSPKKVFHLAMYGGYSHQDDFSKIVATNFLGTVNLLDACVSEGFEYFINTGTSSEYGVKKSRMAENDVPEPIDPYGVTKTAATLYCQSVAKRHNLRIFTLRLFSPYGYFEDSNRLIPYVIKNCLDNKELRLSNPNFVRDFIFIEDVIDAYLKVAETANRLTTGEIFNVGSGKQHNLQEVVDIIKTLTNYRKESKWGERAGRHRDTANVWEADIEKIRRNTAWVPKTSLPDGIAKTITWFKNHANEQLSKQRT
jgi:nucleoside-diphosphate-sugar epimerase